MRFSRCSVPAAWVRFMMAVPVGFGGGFQVGSAVPLFEFRSGTVPGFAPYAVATDGQRFLINSLVEEPNGPLTVVLNWTDQVKR